MKLTMGRVFWVGCMLLGMLAVLAAAAEPAADSLEVVQTTAQADKPSIELAVEGTEQDEGLQAMVSLRTMARKLGKCVHLDKQHLVDCGSPASVEPRKHATHGGTRLGKKAKYYAAAKDSYQDTYSPSHPPPPTYHYSAQPSPKHGSKVPPTPLSQRVSKKNKQRKALNSAQRWEEAELLDHEEQYGDSGYQYVSAKKMQHKHKDPKHRQHAQASAKHHETAPPPTVYYGAGHADAGYRAVKLSSAKPRAYVGRHNKETAIDAAGEQHAQAEKHAVAEAEAESQAEAEAEVEVESDTEAEAEQELDTQPDDAGADVAGEHDQQADAASGGSLTNADGSQIAGEEVQQQAGDGAADNADADLLSAEYWTVLSSQG